MQRQPHTSTSWLQLPNVMRVLQREFVLVKRNAFLYIFRFFLTMFMAFVTATLFLRTQLHADSVQQGQLYFAVVFFSLIMLMFDGFAEMTFTILRLQGFYKQRGMQTACMVQTGSHVLVLFTWVRLLRSL